MIIDIALQGLTIKKNGLADTLDAQNAGLPGVIALSWIHCRPDLQQNVLIWPFKVNSITRNNAIEIPADWTETLAFRQTAIGKSKLKIEVITIQEQNLVTKIMVGILGLGIKTAGGLITSSVASSIFETLTSELKLDESSIHKVGAATLNINPKNLELKTHEIPLLVDKEKVILEPITKVPPSNTRAGYVIEKGQNGVIQLSFSKFDPEAD